MLIQLFGDIDENATSEVSSLILTAGQAADDITMLLSTYGGEMYCALAIYDLLKHHPGRVTTIATGPCMSAGVIILQAGDVRAMTENAHIMTHYGQDGAEGEGDARQNEALHKLHKQIVGSKVNVTTRTVNSWFKQNTYFNSDRALEVGLVDEVIRANR